ncbi:unnamed protein product, partial [Diplocarpon coronariae]
GVKNPGGLWLMGMAGEQQHFDVHEVISPHHPICL